MTKLYRPRGIFKQTARESWITKVWYHNRKTALKAVDDFGATRSHRNIRIIESSENGMYNGKIIRANQIDKYYYE